LHYKDKGKLLSSHRACFRAYNNSYALAVMSEYPVHCWNAWNFTQTPRQWWPALARNFIRGDPVARIAVQIFLDYMEEHAVLRGGTYLSLVMQQLAEDKLTHTLWRECLKLVDNKQDLEAALLGIYTGKEWSANPPRPSVIGSTKGKLALSQLGEAYVRCFVVEIRWKPPKGKPWDDFQRRKLFEEVIARINASQPRLWKFLSLEDMYRLKYESVRRIVGKLL